MKNKIIILSLILVLIFQINVLAGLDINENYNLSVLDSYDSYGLPYITIINFGNSYAEYVFYSNYPIIHDLVDNKYVIDGDNVQWCAYHLHSSYKDDLTNSSYSTHDIYTIKYVNYNIYDSNGNLEYGEEISLQGDLTDEWWLEVQPGQSIRIVSDLTFYNNNAKIEVSINLLDNSNQLIGYEYLQKDGEVISQDQLYINNFGIRNLYENEEIVLKNTSNEVMKVFIQWDSLDAASPDTELPTYEIIDGIPSNYYVTVFNYIKDEHYYLPISVRNIINNKKIFTIEYDETILEVDDLSILTYEKETSTGTIEGTGINITSYTLGKITFEVTKDIQQNQTWSGLVNIVKFKALSSGQITINLLAGLDINENYDLSVLDGYDSHGLPYITIINFGNSYAEYVFYSNYPIIHDLVDNKYVIDGDNVQWCAYHLYSSYKDDLTNSSYSTHDIYTIKYVNYNIYDSNGNLEY